jgi:hypothetical protein
MKINASKLAEYIWGKLVQQGQAPDFDSLVQIVKEGIRKQEAKDV